MATIKYFPLFRHLRAEPTNHVILWKDGQKRKSGPGLSFWFMPLGASLCEVPLDDRDLAFCFRARSLDFQEVVVNGVITYRTQDPELLAQRIDFSLDTQSGAYRKDPLDKLAVVVNELAQQLAATALLEKPLTTLLEEGVARLRERIHRGLVEDQTLSGMGLLIVGTRVSAVSPTAEMEKALQMPTRERIQESADHATFQRRALAVEKERAIQENELANQIELARREEQLIAQRGQNERKRATDLGESRRIEAEASAGNVRINASAQAESIRVLEEAKVEAERARMAIYELLPPVALFGLAARELAGKLEHIDHLSLSPDTLGPMLQRLLGASSRRLEEREGK
jgi:regulator of protease activity HflC (stomatin/prohibitin superfamily)